MKKINKLSPTYFHIELPACSDLVNLEEVDFIEVDKEENCDSNVSIIDEFCAVDCISEFMLRNTDNLLARSSNLALF